MVVMESSNLRMNQATNTNTSRMNGPVRAIAGIQESSD
jgi:hypothetical protein